MIPISDACYDVRAKTVVAVMGSQMGKTDTMANVMGHRLDDDPAPMLYVAPTEKFIDKTFEPRFTAMVDSTRSLKLKRAPGKERKDLKKLAGVEVSFGWAGSPVSLAGNPACKVFLDEIDRMPANVGDEGDPYGLAKGRYATFPDGQGIVFSTATLGTVETEVDPVSGLDRWKISDDDQVQSRVWRLWQNGTRKEWSWPCPDCRSYFIPRMRLLVWPDNSGPYEARKLARLACPHCGSAIHQRHKTWMNARGRYVAPGQKVHKNGRIWGTAPESNTDSFWVSGLASPWRDWGDLAYDFIEAVRSGDPDVIQPIINIGFGELYAMTGNAPEWRTVAARRAPYKMRDIPAGVKTLLLTVDVQAACLYYVIRGWGDDLESWGIEHGQILGATEEKKRGPGEQDPWEVLGKFQDVMYSGVPISGCWIDSGTFTQTVYSFCRKHKNWAYPSKGRDVMEKPLTASRLDLDKRGRRHKAGLMLWHINNDYFKTWVHTRVERDPSLPGGWHIAEDYTGDYCKQVVDESKVIKPSGKIVWWSRARNNHYFDCETMNVAQAFSRNLHMKSPGPPKGAAPGGEKTKVKKAIGIRRKPGSRSGGYFRR